MTPQEVFDAAVGGIIKQDALCKTDEGGCLYRYGNHKCAAGHVIPNTLYEPDFEGNDIESVLDMSPVLHELFGAHTQLLVELQEEHDHAPLSGSVPGAGQAPRQGLGSELELPVNGHPGGCPGAQRSCAPSRETTSRKS